MSKRVRYEVLRRDGNRCRYCGNTAAEGATLTIDHVVPVALGGGDDPSNLVAACRDCNAGKTSSSPDAPLVAEVADDAIRWRAAMTLAVAELEQQHGQVRAYREAFYNEWMSWTFTSMARTADLPDGWRSTVDRWHVTCYPIEMLIDAIQIAMNGPADRWSKFNYLCGVMKKKLAEIQERARDLARPPFECDCGYEQDDSSRHASERDCEIAMDGNMAGWKEGNDRGQWWAAKTHPDRLLEHVIDGTCIPPSNPDSLFGEHPLSRLLWVA
jgi:hypothetical protein